MGSVTFCLACSYRGLHPQLRSGASPCSSGLLFWFSLPPLTLYRCRMIQNSPDNIELIISQSKGMSSSAFRSWRVFFILRSASLPSGTGILSHGGLVHYFPRGNGFGTNQ